MNSLFSFKLQTIFIFFFGVILFQPHLSNAASTKELEAQVAELQRVIDAQAKNTATSLNQLQEVLSEFQALTGKVDQGLYENQEQAKIIADSQQRLEILEDKISLLVKQLEELKAAGLLPPPQAKNLKEFQTYEKALSQFNAEAYKEAIQGLREFIATNPKSVYAENAQYWIGEGYYSMRDYPAAVAEYQKVIKKFPAGNKAPASLLKQGLAFYEMQSLADAKAFLTKLITKYPGTPESVRAREKINKIDDLMEVKAREAVEQKTVQ